MNHEAQANTEPLDDDFITQESKDESNDCGDAVDEVIVPDQEEDVAPMSPAEIEQHLNSAACDELSRQCIDQLLGEVITATEGRQRALADFKNFQRRAGEEEQRMTRIASASAFRSVLPVLDQLQLAIQQDLEAVSSEQVLEGVRIAGDELVKILSDHGVTAIEPAAGDAFEPRRHEAMMNMDSEEYESGQIVQVLQVGFHLGEQVLRPAKVSVAS
jgi:molecular chaperone GrpE